MARKIIALVLLCLISTNEALRLLVLFPLPSKSHSILGQGVVTRLLEAGHEVVHVTSFPRDKPVANLKEINVGVIGERFRQENDKTDMFKLRNLVGQNVADSPFFLFFCYSYVKQFLAEDNIVSFLSDPKEKFDAVIVEWFFSETFAGIPPLFQSPLIWVGSTEAHWQVLKLVDDIPNPAYSVDLLSTTSAPLSFWERAEELWKLMKKLVIVNIIVATFEKMLYNNVYPQIAAKRGVTLPSYEEAVYNASFLLLNSHPSIGTPYRLPQNAKYIGGYHVDDKVKPLPKDLQKLMDEAKHGVIYFSMGSNLKSEDMSTEMRDSLLNMFSKLKQTIIWKFESDLDKVPANIHLVKWAPQQSILVHPNLKMFITHGGQLSTTESIHHGVPVIGIPVMGDQHVNMKSVEKKGFGIRVKFNEDVAAKLIVAIKEMLSNPSYKAKAKELSTIYHDRPVPPGKELVYWVEHVVRTRGALHLRSPALSVSWYQKAYLDLAAVILVVLLTVYFILKKCLSLRRSKQKSDSKKKD